MLIVTSNIINSKNERLQNRLNVHNTKQITVLPSAATVGGAATAGAFAVSTGPLQRESEIVKLSLTVERRGDRRGACWRRCCRR